MQINAGVLLPSCACVFSLLLFFVYILKNKSKTIENRLYLLMMILIILDSICAMTLQIIPNNGITSNEEIAVNIVNRIDFCFLLFYVSFMLLYTLLITIKEFDKKYKKYAIIICAINILTIIISCFFKINIVSIENNYTIEGNALLPIYAIGLLYLVTSLLIVFINFKRINKKHIPILSTIILAIFLIIIYYNNPYIIIISITLTFLNFLMYFTIENPDAKIAELEKEAKEEAIRASNTKSEFLASMSHELRTPLNAITGLSEDIESFKEQVPVEVKEDSQDIVKASDTLLDIIGNILDVSKIESGKLEIVESDYDPKEEFESLAKIQRTKVAEKPLEFSVSIDEALPKVLFGDRIRIKQIVNNLISNAIKYTDAGKVNFTVKWNDENKMMIIKVADTGRGVKPEDIDKLFAKYDRLQVEKVSSVQGTGLGLSITKNLIEAMSGEVKVDSVYGKGTTFTVILPQKLGDTERFEKLKAESAGGPVQLDFTGKKLLVVDDNELNIKVLKKAIKTFNFEIDEATNGLSAVNLVLSGKQYDLILMDILMPIMTGPEAIQKLHEDPKFNIPVVALTADAMTGAKEKYMSMGFVDYIAKPFSRDAIAKKLSLLMTNIPEQSVQENSNTVQSQVIENQPQLPQESIPVQTQDSPVINTITEPVIEETQTTVDNMTYSQPTTMENQTVTYSVPEQATITSEIPMAPVIENNIQPQVIENTIPTVQEIPNNNFNQVQNIDDSINGGDSNGVL